MNSILFDSQEITPSKVVCIGRNYVDHIRELNNEMPSSPVIFVKPNSAISDHIVLKDDDLHYEGEICFIIEKGEITGVGLGLDLTKRKLQSELKAKQLPWERAKAFDNSAIFSEFIHFDKSPEKLTLEIRKNGEVIQSGGVELMIYKPQEILEEIKTFMTLEDGDIIMTGTPKGVGKISEGDAFEGKLYNDTELILRATWPMVLKENNSTTESN